MKLSLTLLAAAIIGTAHSVSALDITCTTPGTLCDAGIPAETVSLSVSGTINAADFAYITDNLTSLTSLDLQNVSIAPYEGTALVTGVMRADANTLPQCALIGSKVSSINLPAGLTAIGDAALAGLPITDITIPPTVTTLGSGVFSRCTSLTSLTIPASVNVVGDNLARGCTSLTTVNIEGNIGGVPAYAFDGCTSLKSFKARASLSGVGNYAFSGCSSLAKFDFTPALSVIGDYAFYGTSLSVADMSACVGMKSLGAYSFGDCAKLTSVTIPEGVTSVGVGAFFNDSKITAIYMPQTITVLNALTFKGLTEITNVSNIMHQHVTEIGDYALTGWHKIESVNMSGELEHVGDHAMEDWKSLKSINADRLRTIPSMGEKVWDGIDQSKVALYVHLSDIEMYKEAPQWGDFDVQQIPNDVQEVISDPESTVRIYMSGNDICVLSDNDIELVEVYDTGGMLLVRVEPYDTAAMINVSDITSRLLIVRALCQGDRVTTAKLKR